MEINYTIEQLRAATKTQILTKLTTWLSNRTKAQLIGLILTVADDLGDRIEIPEPTLSDHYPDGQIKSSLQVNRDVLGNRTGGRDTTWTYYPSGCVQDIIIQEFDASGTEIWHRRIHHYEDGRQPITTEVP